MVINKKIIGITGCLLFTMPGVAMADSQLGYDDFSFLEKPLAVEVGAATLSARVTADQSVEYDTISDDDRYNSKVRADVRMDTQLPNSWQVGVRYVGNFDRLKDGGENQKYEDDFSVTVSDEIGTLSAGNVTGEVREKTRRMHPTGNADLDNDDFLGNLDESGGFYSVRLNSYTLSVTADKEGRAEGGISYERNLGKHNVFFSGRVRTGDTSEDEDIQNVDDNTILNGEGKTYGAAVVGSFTYGSFLMDSEAGYEVVDVDRGGDKNDHPFASVGMTYKDRRVTLSGQGAVGAYDKKDLRSASLGARYDLVRGMSVNLGVNYTYVDGNDKTEAISSIRYSF